MAQPIIQLTTSNGSSQFQKAQLTWKIKDYEKTFAFSKVAGDYSMWSEEFLVDISADAEKHQGPILTALRSNARFRMELVWNHPPKENSGGSGATQVDDGKCKSIGMYLNFYPNCRSGEITLTFYLSSLSDNGNARTLTATNEPKKMLAGNNSWGWPTLLKKDQVTKANGILDSEGNLTIICNMEIMCGAQVQSMNRVPLYQPILLGDELNLAKTSKDVTIICRYGEDIKDKNCLDKEEEEKKNIKDNEIQCHKLILTTRSDVFMAMFSHNQTSENQTNTIVIDDTPIDVLREFVEYLYTDRSKSLLSDKIPDIGNMLRLADKYNVLSLKQRCEILLLRLIKSNTAGEIYMLAYLHNCEPLRNAVVCYMAHNFEESFKSSWMVNYTKDMQDQLMKDIWAHKLKD